MGEDAATTTQGVSIAAASLWRWFLVSAPLIVTAGVILTNWSLTVERKRIQEELVQQVDLFSFALDPELVSQLRGDETDMGHEAYAEVKQHLLDARTCFGRVRFLYLMREVDGHIVFLADSEPPGSEDLSPPGQIYEEASESLWKVFRTGRPSSEGPLSDRWGEWMSAFTPLVDPQTGETVAVIGIDVDASLWRSHVFRFCLPSVLATALLLLIILAGYLLFRVRLSRGTVVWVEAAMTVAAGLVLTAGAVHLALDAQRYDQRMTFRKVGAAQVQLVAGVVGGLRDRDLEGLGRFFEASTFVDRDDFRIYSTHLARDRHVESWGWIPAVHRHDAERFVGDVRGGGFPSFSIWELAGGRRVPAGDRMWHYPVCYSEPAEENLHVIGLDQGQDPHLKAAMDQAARMRRAVASKAVARAEDPGTCVTQVYRPVFARDDSNRLSGFASASIRMDRLLAGSVVREAAGEAPLVVMALGEVAAGEPTQLLAGAIPDEAQAFERDDAPFRRADKRLLLTAPLFAFGKTYVLALWPGSGLGPLSAYTGVRAGVAGLALTGLLASLVALVGSRRSLLEREVAQRTAELRDANDQMRIFIEAIPDAVFIKDGAGRWRLINKHGEALFQMEHVAWQQKTDLELAEMRPALCESHRNCHTSDEQAWQAGTMQMVTERIPGRDGCVRDYEVRKLPLFEPDGRRKALVVIGRDVTEQLESNWQRDQMQKQLAQSQKIESVGRLAGGVAHDANNMLQAILGNVALALEDDPSPVQRDYLQGIRSAAERTAGLTRQLLAFASRQTARPTVLNLNDTIAGMLSMLRRLIGEDIELAWSPGQDLWPVRMDPSQVDQILTNLVVNARDAIEGGGRISIATLNVTCDSSCALNFPDCQPGEKVEIVVRDTGRGMSAETMAHAFEPFFTTKDKGQGAGLGLATVYGIVRQNRGCIRMQSQEGYGTSFHIRLPRAPAGASTEGAATATAELLRGAGETILLVEDEPAVLKYGREVLVRLGYHVLAAATPHQALDLARDHAAALDLLVTDVVMPGMNGRELAGQLDKIKPGLKCLYISGYTADVVAKRGVLDSEVTLLQKPFTAEMLAALIREVLDRPARI